MNLIQEDIMGTCMPYSVRYLQFLAVAKKQKTNKRKQGDKLIENGVNSTVNK